MKSTMTPTGLLTLGSGHRIPVPTHATPASIRHVIWRMLITWQKRSQDRAHLKALDVYLLKDIGLTREMVNHETSKPFWRS